MSEDIAEKLSELSESTTMFVPVPSRGISKELRKEYKSRKVEFQYNKKLKIIRYNLMCEGKNPVFRALRYLIQNFKQFYCGLKTKETDLIFAGSTPPTQGVMCAILKTRLLKKNKKYIPFVYNLQDIFPDSLVNANMTRKGSLLYKIGRKIEDYTYKSTDIIIVPGEDFKRNIISKGVPSEKIRVIHNWIDSEKIKPVIRENNTLFDEYKIDRNKFIVLYAGNFGASQGTEVIVNAAQALKNEKDIQFVLFGGGSEFEKTKKEILAKKISNVIINPLLPPKRISEVYSMGDVSLITCKRGVGQAGMPSKTWSIMACNTPIIASFDTDSELADILEKSGAGICVEPQNVQALAEAIQMVKNKCISFSNGRDYVLKYADKRVCLKKYAEVIEKFKGLR